MSVQVKAINGSHCQHLDERKGFEVAYLVSIERSRSGRSFVPLCEGVFVEKAHNVLVFGKPSWRRSGQTQTAFAAGLGCSMKRLSMWKNRFDGEIGGAVPVTFVEVKAPKPSSMVVEIPGVHGVLRRRPNGLRSGAALRA